MSDRRARWLAEPEVMDHPRTDPADLSRALRELGWINRHLGGHRALLRGLDRLVPRVASELALLDVGSGGGDLIGPVIDWAQRRGLHRLRLVCTDFNLDACRTIRASRRCSDEGVELIVLQSEASSLPMAEAGVDVVHFGLFLHHFDGEQIRRLLEEARRVSRRGVILNDLHAHVLPWAATRFGSSAFSRSRMVKHDGPLSVRRGFNRSELAALTDWDHVEWVWPFRWLATCPSGNV